MKINKLTLYKIYRVQEVEKYTKFVKMFNKPEDIDLDILLPESLLDNFKNTIEECDKKVSLLDQDYNYKKIFNNITKFIASIEKIKINNLAYKAFSEVEKNETIKSNLKLFKPNNGYAKKISYDLTKTLTGRLVVKNGSPNILTLPSRCRKIFESKWSSKGSLLYIDFNSLEPRLARKLLGHKVENDLYKEILEIIDENIDRSIIKKATISILYGKTSSLDGISIKKSADILAKTREYFQIEKLVDKANNSKNNIFRTNFYGRPIFNLQESKENKIINNYLQSSAVDVALQFFSNMFLNRDTTFIRPVAVIHDAVIVDVHKDIKQDFINEIKGGFNCPKLGNFPITIEEMNEN